MDNTRRTRERSRRSLRRRCRTDAQRNTRHQEVSLLPPPSLPRSTRPPRNCNLVKCIQANSQFGRPYPPRLHEAPGAASGDAAATMGSRNAPKAVLESLC